MAAVVVAVEVAVVLALGTLALQASELGVQRPLRFLRLTKHTMETTRIIEITTLTPTPTPTFEPSPSKENKEKRKSCKFSNKLTWYANVGFLFLASSRAFNSFETRLHYSNSNNLLCTCIGGIDHMFSSSVLCRSSDSLEGSRLT